ncbi:hypothetical protein HYC85_008289 [Camellia sinensis]|uniref:Uncharacterized protein n=1 Tax=Camellia sinensis TaxID=4442 RepID=A0A7J7HRE7_CAMSI|nr:hypothetical protein HYC85_008289 [Camellia sinensis]
MTRNLGPQFSYLNFRCHFPSLSRENPNLLNFSHRKWLYHPKILTLCSTITSNSLSYGEWDDPRLGGGSVHSGESNQLRYLDKSLIGTTKRPNDEKIRVSIKKLRNLMDFLSGFDGKINNLINGIKKRSVVEACTDTMLVENQEVERNLNQKLSRRKKEVGETGFDLLQFIGGLIRETSHDNFPDSVDFRVDLKQMKTETSFEQEWILHKTNGSYRENREKEIYKTHSREEEGLISEDDPSHNSDIGSFPSLTVSDDIVFSRYLMEANAFLKEARECLRVNGDEGHAESVLYESAKLRCKAIDMKPLSTGCGPVGKYLSSSRRTEIENHDLVLIQKRGKVLKGLLVEAGRKYRLALSIDGNDTRALYNWGLALSFRAQLIADIGPEAAVDADKIFLAASDKFDAMMPKSNVYTPDALYRWGVALQQRSRLRPRDSEEKAKLLQQATRLYQDALDIDSDNLQVTEALYSCISVLNFRR